MLDALRGVAALAVLIFHLFPHAVPHGYLAVDFFFMLSGFVMANAYQAKLDSGWSSWQFFRIRLIRLYPLYALGLVLGFAFALAQIHARAISYSYPAATGIFVAGLFFIPSVGMMFPFDGVLWSLFFEVAANILHSFVGRRRGVSTLAIAAGLAVVGLSVLAWRYGSLNVGFLTRDMVGGVCRVTFAYIAGMLLQRLGRRHYGSIAAGSITVLLLALFCIPAQSGLYDLCAVIVAFPVIVFLAASTDLQGFPSTLGILLGRLSYAVYVLQTPVARIVGRVSVRIPQVEQVMAGPLGSIIVIATVFVVSWAADRADQRLRQFLNGRRMRVAIPS